MDYHNNIFYYYGKEELTADGEAQLENNTTKALINTLQYSSPELTSHFLSNVLNKKVDAKVFKFHLQSEKSSQELQGVIKTAKHFYVLAITPNGKDPKHLHGAGVRKFINQSKRNSIDKSKIIKFLKESKNKILLEESNEIDKENIKKWFPELHVQNLYPEDVFDLYDYYVKGSIPDAWIYWGNNIVLIENKTKCEVTNSQILRHCRLLSKYNRKVDPIKIYKSWRKDISVYFAQHKFDGLTQFLLDQLRDYLEAINMGELKFTYDDFLAFDELDAGQFQQIRSAHERLYNLGQKIVDSMLQGHWIRKQKLQANYIGINIVSDEFKEKKPFEVPHYSMALTGDLFFTVYVTFESKPLIRKLEKKYKLDKTALEYKLEKSLSAIDEKDYFFCIYDKWHVTSGGSKQNRSTWFPLINIPFDVLDGIPNWGKFMLDKIISLSSNERRKETINNISFLKRFSGKTVHATISVGKNFKWHEVHDKKMDIQNDIEKSVLAIKPFYDFLIDISRS